MSASLIVIVVVSVMVSVAVSLAVSAVVSAAVIGGLSLDELVQDVFWRR